ncbi:MAG TPA: hypothetical protein VN647_08795 [Nitrospira sp.]|nr:hypothetical protein [Nitrospira sp.]
MAIGVVLYKGMEVASLAGVSVSAPHCVMTKTTRRAAWRTEDMKHCGHNGLLG